MWQIFLPIVLFVLLLYVFRKPKYNLPPGPPVFPLIGSLISLLRASGKSKNPGLAFQTLGKVYGPVIYLMAGSVPTVAVNDFESILRVGANEDLPDRVVDGEKWFTEKSRGKPLGLVFSKQDIWVESRAYSHKLMNKHGFNKKRILERLILHEMMEFIEELKDEIKGNNGVVFMADQFNALFLNILWTIMMGERINSDDPILKKVLVTSNDFLKSGKFGGGLAGIYPGLIKHFPNLTGYTKLRETGKNFREVLEEAIAERRLSGAPYAEEPNSFIDDFLLQIDQRKRKGETESIIYSDENLVSIMQDFILGGNDTESSLSKFGIIYMLKYPQVQVKLQEEVDRVLGTTRLVSTDDIPSLIYVQAALYEILRMANAVSVMARIAIKDTKLNGYDIPKGTMVICNLWAANYQDSMWENPNEFNPGRFISADGSLKDTSKIMAFGFGKRRCIAEQMAKTNMILFLSTLIQHFEFGIDPASGMPSDDDTHGLTRSPVPFNVLIKIRN